VVMQMQACWRLPEYL